MATLPTTPVGGSESRPKRPPTPVVIFYGAALVLLGAYGSSLMVRHTGQVWPVIDNQLVDAFEVVLALACFARGLRRADGRGTSLALGAGLLSWALGDVVWTLDSSAGTPSAADGFYLLFYPLAYLALMLMVRTHVGRAQSSVWLDGTIAGLGAAAVTAAFAFDMILHSVGGSAASVAVNLAYPVGDLILLALAIGAVVMVPGRPARLLVFAAGCALIAVGDTVYLFQSSAGSYQVGTPVNLTWPAAIFLMSTSVWLPTSARSKAPIAERMPRFVVPGLASAAGLVILMVGDARHVSHVALGLAAATLVAAGARLAFSLRAVRHHTESRRQQAVTDELTGLGNRRQLLNELEGSFLAFQEAEAGHDDTRLALLLIDLDHFKEINDSFGHPTGDALLRQIGPRIGAAVRPGDVVARLGGDEFAVLLSGAGAKEATSVARRITSALDDPITVDRASLHVEASIGIAVAPDHATDAAELLRCADVAMYRAKGARSSFDIYEAALDDGADRLRLMEELRVAMTSGALVLHFQPEIDLRSGEVVAVEALLRWPHPRLGLVPPDHFLPLAEETGLIRRLTEWVLEEAMVACAQWWRAGHPAAVAVNLLATDLLDTSLPDQVTEILSRVGLPPQALVLEITETMVMADMARARRVIKSLSDSGIVVSIDDFGTGFSSLAYLSDLAVGEIKLDKMFTSRLHAREELGRDEAIVRSVIDLGHALGLRVVAEGIERPDLIGFLVKLGCDHGQGFGIQPPCPAAQLDFTVRDSISLTARAGR